MMITLPTNKTSDAASSPLPGGMLSPINNEQLEYLANQIKKLTKIINEYPYAFSTEKLTAVMACIDILKVRTLKVEDLSTLISEDELNRLKLGSDGRLYVAVAEGVDLEDLSTFISEDERNQLKLGSDNRLYVPVAEGVDLENLATLISGDELNRLNLGSDNKLSLPVAAGVDLEDLSTFISDDSHNQLEVGTDNKLYVPETEKVNTASLEVSNLASESISGAAAYQSEVNQEVTTTLSAQDQRITNLANLGKHVGTFDTFSDLPYNALAFMPLVPSVNDFANIRNDEQNDGATTRYIIDAIGLDDQISWAFDIVYSTDITGFESRVAGVEGDISSLDSRVTAVETDISEIKNNVNDLEQRVEEISVLPAATDTERGGVRVQNGNGLTLADTDGLQMGLASQTTAGAMSADDKVKLDGIGPVAGSYTFVIDSNAALMAWASNAAGNDYSRILIKTGAWTGMSAVSISNERTLLVVGEQGSSISTRITGAVNSERQRFENVTVITPSGNAFSQCSNLTNCTAVVSDNAQAGFSNCLHLVNCRVSGTGRGFLFCRHLNNCRSVAASTLTSFESCSNLVSCTANSNGRSFSHCTDLLNCISTTVGDASFVNCSRLINCIGNGTMTAFWVCHTGIGNRQDGSSLVSFTQCFMEQGTNSTPWANTAAGGWNLP